MNSVISVLIRILCVQFYQSHATLFLIGLGMSVGMLKADDHIALGTAFVSSPLLMLIPISAWIIYAIMVLKFNADYVRLEENSFLFNVGLMSPVEQFEVLFPTCLMQLLPVVAYSMFLVLLALKQLSYFSLLLATGPCISLGLALTIHLKKTIGGHETEAGSALARLLNNRMIKPYPLFFPEWIARKEIAVLLGTKFVCLMLIYAGAQLYKFDTYDVRLLGMTITVAFAMQSTLIWNLHHFETRVLSLTRNMPISLFKRAGGLLVTFSILLAPDTAMIVSRFPAQLPTYDMISCILMGWSICMFFYGMLYWRSLGIEQLTTRTFIVVMSLIPLILFRTPILLLAVFLSAIGLTLWRVNYYRFDDSMSDVRDDPPV